jgi:hypothetical protein
VVSFRFNDVPAKIRDWWLVMTAEEVDVCDFDPGYDVAVSVTGSLRRMVEIWRGDLGCPAALRSGIIQLDGPERSTCRAEVVPGFAIRPGTSVSG